ncbi:beta-ketoacyl-ACP synthase III, partial [Klebsiella pneumoniae]|nr:beta-ketoacyl-ACP synthase III [Klebsiella pneumoniae]
MHDVVISGTGLWVAPEVITNEELVASYNAYTQRYNAQHAEAIAAGELTALA